MFYRVHSSSFARILLLILWMTVVSFFFSGCSFISTDQTQAASLSKDQQNHLKEIDRTSEQLYQSVAQGKPEAAFLLAQALNVQLIQLKYDGITSAEGASAMLETALAAKRKLTAVSYNAQEALIAAVKVRLAADALLHKQDPMWLQYYKLLKEDADRIAHSLKAKDQYAFGLAIKRFNGHFSVIRPSVLISKDVSEVMQMDSLIHFLKSGAEDPAQMDAGRESAVYQLNLFLDELFMKKHVNAFAPVEGTARPLLWATSIGLVIITVLSYVAWRKFVYEREHAIPVKRRSREGNQL